MQYDLAVIGAGPAGFNAACRGKSLGLKVALAEESQIGGTCLNRGCIPTKALIQSAKVYLTTKRSACFGIKSTDSVFDLAAAQARKEKLVLGLRQAMEVKLRGITVLRGKAVIASPDTLRVDSTQLSAKHIIIASGSAPVELPGLKFDGRKIISSDSLLEIKKIPSSLLIVGAGAVGCEFASLFSSLGSRVAIAEKMPQLLPGLDKELAGRLESVYKKRKIKLSLNTDAAGLNLDEYESVLVCVGRIPRTADLGLEELGIKRDKRRIITDDFLRTASGNIYAAGDCSAELLLAHFAAYQGYLAAENIASDSPQKVSAAYVPNCIFTDPEIASVGPSEDELRQMGREIKVHRFDFLASGMARILEETEGFLKIISDKKTSVVLGASIIGPKATELIGALTIAAANRLSIPQLKETIFAHPTLSECLGEALGH